VTVLSKSHQGKEQEEGRGGGERKRELSDVMPGLCLKDKIN
jgi:hypothetical protein